MAELLLAALERLLQEELGDAGGESKKYPRDIKRLATKAGARTFMSV